jgi:hypothetical protein
MSIQLRLEIKIECDECHKFEMFYHTGDEEGFDFELEDLLDDAQIDLELQKYWLFLETNRGQKAYCPKCKDKE